MVNLNAARKLIADNKLVEAREIVVEALHNDYDNIDAWMLLTDCARDREEYARALREILRIDPENAEARKLAIAMARTSETPPDDDEGLSPPPPRRRAKTSPTRSLFRIAFNIFAFLVIIGIAGGIAFAFLNWQEDQNNQDAETTPIVATLDPAQQCVIDVPEVYARVPARCAGLQDGEACLINPRAQVESSTGQTDLLTLAGDKALLESLFSVQTFPFDRDDGSWGVVVLNGPTEENDEILMAITSDVRIQFVDNNLNQITFSSNPTPAECPAIPPAGLLLHTNINEPRTIEINGETLQVNGTVFVQVDAAADMRAVVTVGELFLMERDLVVRENQWVRIPVDSSLVTTGESAEVFESEPNIRGDINNLFALGNALNLMTETWQIVGLNAPVVITATPQDNDMQDDNNGETEDENDLATATLSPSDTPTPVPPDQLTPSATPTDQATETPENTEAPTEEKVFSTPTSDATLEFQLTEGLITLTPTIAVTSRPSATPTTKSNIGNN